MQYLLSIPHADPYVLLPLQQTASTDSSSLSYLSRPSNGKQRVVVLGSGWAAMSFVKSWNESLSSKYELVLLSPQELLCLHAPPAGHVRRHRRGAVDRRAGALRAQVQGKVLRGQSATRFLPEEKALVACFPEDAGFPEACFKLPYDILVLGVGCVNNTFGIQGVRGAHDVSSRRSRTPRASDLRVSECFERAALPADDQGGAAEAALVRHRRRRPDRCRGRGRAVRPHRGVTFQQALPRHRRRRQDPRRRPHGPRPVHLRPGHLELHG
jgi:hypothetical protein